MSRPVMRCNICNRLSAYVGSVNTGAAVYFMCGLCVDAFERSMVREQEQRREMEGSGIPDPGALT